MLGRQNIKYVAKNMKCWADKTLNVVYKNMKYSAEK